MKNKNLQKSKTLFIFLLSLAGMTNTFAQEFTTYKGKFEMSGFGNVIYNSGIHSAKENGYAQYEYREATDGTRIFEGDFYFIGDEKNFSKYVEGGLMSSLQELLKDIDYNTVKDDMVVVMGAVAMAPFAMGKLKNDKQVGKWVWGYWADGMFVYKEIIYDDFGNANGTLKQYRYNINYGEFWHNAGYRNSSYIYEPTGWLIGEFADNTLVSANYRFGYKESDKDKYYKDPIEYDLTYNDLYHYEVSGKFNSRGPCGKWIVSGDYFEDNGKYTVVEFDNTGTCIANYWIDQSTGDKKHPQYLNSGNNPIQYIDHARKALNTMKEFCGFRSTPKE